MRIHQLLERTLQVDSSFVRKEIYDHYDELTSAVNFTDLIRTLNFIFDPYNIEFEIDEEGLKKYQITRTADLGLVDAEAFQNGEIVVRVTSLLFDSFQDDKTLKELLVALSSTIRHELVHREQFKRSQGLAAEPYTNVKHKRLSPYQKYIADPHELYAMAHEVIDQLQMKGISKNEIIQELRKSRSSILTKSQRYATIYDHFSANDKFKVIPRLKSLIFQTLTQQAN